MSLTLRQALQSAVRHHCVELTVAQTFITDIESTDPLLLDLTLEELRAVFHKIARLSEFIENAEKLRGF